MLRNINMYNKSFKTDLKRYKISNSQKLTIVENSQIEETDLGQ